METLLWTFLCMLLSVLTCVVSVGVVRLIEDEESPNKTTRSSWTPLTLSYVYHCRSVGRGHAFYYIYCEMVFAPGKRVINTFFGRLRDPVQPQCWSNCTADLWSQRTWGWDEWPCKERPSKALTEKMKLSTSDKDFKLHMFCLTASTAAGL